MDNVGRLRLPQQFADTSLPLGSQRDICGNSCNRRSGAECPKRYMYSAAGGLAMSLGVSGTGFVEQVVPHHLGAHSRWWKQLEQDSLAKWGDRPPAERVSTAALLSQGRRNSGDGRRPGGLLRRAAHPEWDPQSWSGRTRSYHSPYQAQGSPQALRTWEKGEARGLARCSGYKQ